MRRSRDYQYCGPFFAVDEVEGICPWCSKSGAAARKYKGESQNGASVEDGASPESVDEVLHRTPGYSARQEEKRLSHRGECCAFIGHVGWDEIRGLVDELRDDFVNEGYTLQNLPKHLRKAAPTKRYRFRCLRRGRHRFTCAVD